jgi:hypothetical protein
MNPLHSTQFEPPEPLDAEQTAAEIHWLTHAMALRSYERKMAKMDRKALQQRLKSAFKSLERR